jgi:predicted transcriptional regulator
MPESQPLTELQIALLSILWERGQATTAELCEALKPERALAHTTVATLLSRLERRGVVSHRRRGRHYVYEACLGRDEVRRSMVAELTEALFGGDPAALVSHLVADHEVDPEELSRIREMIEREEASDAEVGA